MLCSVMTPDAGGPPSNTKGAVVQITNRKRLMYQFVITSHTEQPFLFTIFPLKLSFRTLTSFLFRLWVLCVT
jgi:hypothetical protein